jgi:hypothetical protein
MIQMTITYKNITIDLMDDGYRVLDGFYPQTPTKDGSVTEKIDLSIIGSSEIDLLAKIRALELALIYAVEYKGAQSAWLNFAPSVSADLWRDRIVQGYLLYDVDLIKRYKQNKAKVSLVIEREGVWNGPEVQIPLTNPNGTANLTGLRIYNCNDAATADTTYKRHNYVDIDGDDVEGDLPGSTRLEMVNLYSGTPTPRYIWIGHNWENPADFVWNFEGEDATITNGSVNSSSSMSGGAYGACGTFYGNGVFTDLFEWAISSAQIDAAAGKLFHVMVRFAASTYIKQMRYRLKINLTGSGGVDPEVWSGSAFYLDSYYGHLIRDMGVIRLPPKLAGYTGLAEHKLVLQAAHDALDATRTLSIDFVQIMPADGWRSIESIASRWVLNNRMIDDGINGDIYQDDGSGSGKNGAWTGYGKAIELKPGRDQRLYFLAHSGTSDTAPIDMKFAVKLYYRPKKRVL